jgi:hypothetical protein
VHFTILPPGNLYQALRDVIVVDSVQIALLGPVSLGECQRSILRTRVRQGRLGEGRMLLLSQPEKGKSPSQYYLMHSCEIVVSTFGPTLVSIFWTNESTIDGGRVKIFRALLPLTTFAPAEVPYLLLTRPEEFHEFWFGWLLALAASPFVAYWLAGRRPTLTKRLRTRRARDREQMALLDTAADRNSRNRRQIQQAAILLLATSVIDLVSIQAMLTDENTMKFKGFVVVMAVVPVTTIVLTSIFWLWDLRYPAYRENP